MRSTPRERWSWYFYDFGNSTYVSVVLLAIGSVYFKEQVVGGAEGSRWWGIALFLSTLVVGLLAPVLGAIADHSARKKRFLAVTTALCCLATAGLSQVQPGQLGLGLLLFVLAEVGYRGGQVFYDSLLPEIADEEDVGKVSGYGFALGTVGGILILLLLQGLAKVSGAAVPPSTAFLVCAVMFGLSTLPIFLFLRERGTPRPLQAGESRLGAALAQVRQTVATARRFPDLLAFMLAFLFFNAGVMMVLDFAGIIGKVVYALEQQGLVRFFILVQVANVVGALVFGKLADRVGPRGSLYAALATFFAAVVLLVMMKPVGAFYALGTAAGFAMAGIQAVSRTFVALLIPRDQSAELFGFYALGSRISALVGPALYGLLAAEGAQHFLSTGVEGAEAERMGQKLAIASIAAFVAVGAVLLRRAPARA